MIVGTTLGFRFAIDTPGLPPAGLVAQHPEPALGIVTRLLQRSIARLAGQHAGTFTGLTLAQARGDPGLVRAIPLDPGQAQARCQ